MNCRTQAFNGKLWFIVLFFGFEGGIDRNLVPLFVEVLRCIIQNWYTEKSNSLLYYYNWCILRKQEELYFDTKVKPGVSGTGW